MKHTELQSNPAPGSPSSPSERPIANIEAQFGHRRLDEMLGAVEVGIWYCDLPFDVLHWDAKVKEHFGLPPDAVVTIVTFYERLHPDDRERTRQSIEACIAGRTNYDIEYRTVSPEGRMRWIRALGRSFYDASGHPIRFDGITVDITRHKAIEADLAKSRRELADVLGRITDGVVAIDADWRYQYVNQAGAQFAGRTPEQLLGKVVWQEFPEAVGTPLYDALQKAMREQQPEVFEDYYQPLDRWLSLRAFPSDAGLSIFYQDVSERKKAEAALRDSESKFRTLADSIPQLAWMADQTGSVFWFNQRWYDYTGTSAAEMQNSGWEGVHDPTELPRVKQGWAKSIKTGAPFEMIFPLRGADGHYRRFLTRMEPVFDEQGKLYRWFGTNTDITAQQQAEDQLRLSQERLRASLEASATGTFRWDIRTNELEWDESLDRLFHLERSQTPRTLPSFLDMIHPNDRDRVRQACQQCAASGADFELEFRVVSTDAAERWFYGRGKTLADDSGPVSMTGACVDVTDRKRSDELLARRARLSALAADAGLALATASELGEMLQLCAQAIVTHHDASLVHIWTADQHDGTLTLKANAGASSHLGSECAQTDTAEASAMRIARDRVPYLSNRLDQATADDLAWAARQGLTGYAAWPLVVEDRAVGVLALFTAHPLADDTLDALAPVANSIAVGIERKRAEIELRVAKEAAEAASQAKSQFLASMSHELRTPLNAIIGYSEMLQEEAQDLKSSGLTKDLQRIHSAGRHLLSVISDILDFSKIEAGRMDVYPEVFELSSMLRDVAATIEPLMAKNGNRFVVDAAPNLGAMNADLTKVRQSLFNLLSNASKFTQRGVVTLQVQVVVQDGVEWLRMAVRDTGAGIPPDRLALLFKPFSQLESSRSTGGTGLGLAITRSFCQMMGGDVTVESKPGAGSTFTIMLPRMREPLSEAAASGAGEEPSRAGDSRPTVLVIDDDAAARDLMQRYLEREHLRAVTASSGEEGLRLAAEIRPQVITLDVIMPGMDGWAVLQALKSNPALCEIPVVMISMVGDSGLGYTLGASDYLLKPVTRESLAKILRRYPCASPPCRVLLVEDDADARAMVSTLLSRQGCQVDVAVDGVDALQRVRRSVPNLVLLDLMMPNMDGFEFAETLRKNERWRNIPIVVLTAKDLTNEDRERLNGYVETILIKGQYHQDELLGQVRELVSKCLTPTAG